MLSRKARENAVSLSPRVSLVRYQTCVGESHTEERKGKAASLRETIRGSRETRVLRFYTDFIYRYRTDIIWCRF